MIAREGEISLFIAEYPVQPNQSRVLPFIAPRVHRYLAHAGIAVINIDHNALINPDKQH
jgi:hypothetical protein